MAPSYDSNGFLITATTTPTAGNDVDALQADGTSTGGFMFPSAVRANEARSIAIVQQFVALLGLQVIAVGAVVV